MITVKPPVICQNYQGVNDLTERPFLWCKVADDKNDLKVVSWRVSQLEAHVVGIWNRVNGVQPKDTATPLQTGVSYVITMERNTHSYYIYVMVSL